MINKFSFAVMAVSIFVGANAQCVTLSPEAIYHRCFTQLTGHRAAESDPILLKVKAKSLAPVNACLQILDSAKLSRNGNRLTLTSNTEMGRAVLGRLHELHATFFTERGITAPGSTFATQTSTLDFLDASAPGLFYTRALFGPGVKASSILTFNQTLRPSRTEADPARSVFSKRDRSYYFFTNKFRLADKGDLIGIEELAPNTEKLVGSNGTLDLGRTLGGGFLGTGMYLLQAVNDDFAAKATVSRPFRRYSGSVYRDVLCREFPVVRFGDAKSFVKTSSPFAFRREQACNQCHSSMDRTANVLRGFEYFYNVTDIRLPANKDKRGPMFFDVAPIRQPAEAGWPDTEVDQFRERPTNGTLYFRSAFNGSLIEKSVSGVHDLGVKLAETDDFYLCLANRYYDYFTSKGIKLNDANELANLAKSDRTGGFEKRLNTIKSLATSLKTKQNLRAVIETIIKSPEYSDSAFGQ